MSGLLYEYFVTLAIFTSGIGLAFILGLRGIVLVPAGFAIGTLLRVLSFSAIELLDAGIHTRAAWLGLALAATLLGLIAARNNRSFWLWSGVAALISSYGPLVTRGLEVRGRPHSDSLWILFMSDLMQASGDLTLLGDRTPIKRGFSLPIMLALGPEGEFLASYIATVFLAMMFVVFWGMREFSPQLKPKYWSLVSIPVVLVLMNTPMFYRAIYYINGHTLVALGLGLAAVASVLAMRDGLLAKTNLIAIAVGLTLVSTSRPEGIALAALVVAPLLAKRWLKWWQVSTIIACPLIGFGVWMWVYEGFLLYDQGISAAAFIGISVLLALVLGIKWLAPVRRFSVPLALLTMVALISAAVIVNPAGIAEDAFAQIQNLFYGEGFWGVFPSVLIVALVAFGLRTMSQEYRNLLVISGLLALGNVVGKLADGGLVGAPDLGRLGWFDSLNRMWIHLLAILLITLIVGLAEWASRFQVSRGEK